MWLLPMTDDPITDQSSASIAKVVGLITTTGSTSGVESGTGTELGFGIELGIGEGLGSETCLGTKRIINGRLLTQNSLLIFAIATPKINFCHLKNGYFA